MKFATCNEPWKETPIEEVFNIAAAANVTAKGDLATAVGEGIADGLDVAGF